MKTLCLCLLLFAFCFTKQNENCFVSFANDNLDSLSLLKNDKAEIDKRMINDQKSLLLFAKAKINLIAIKNSKNAKWPDDIQCSYNVLKDSDNHVIMI